MQIRDEGSKWKGKDGRPSACAARARELRAREYVSFERSCRMPQAIPMISCTSFQQRMPLVSSLLVLSLCICFSWSSPVHLHGISPRRLSLFSEAKFTCDTKKTIDSSQVNDDYCDCADGSDEPGTSACSLGKFYCANKGYREKLLPSSLVNDGVCDCCDGSDEYSGRASCKNTCDVDGEQWRAQQRAMLQKVEEGTRLRAEYIAFAQAASRENKAKIESTKTALAAAKIARHAADQVRPYV